MRILIVEDDPDLAHCLSHTLREAAYAVDTAADGERGYFLAATNPYDLILLDYNLPGLNGREIIARIRQEDIGTPILMLTVRGELSDKVSLLALGADDYLVKPFALSELLARVRAILRRSPAWKGSLLSCGDLKLATDLCQVTKGRHRINLTNKEFSLLEYLLRNKGRVISRQELTEHVWDENADPFSNTLEVHIKNLRKKLGDDPSLIHTFPNRGYKIDNKR